MVTAYESIRERLKAAPGSKWGFIMFRCTYESDDKWNKFMAYFNKLVEVDLEREGIADCFSRLDWCVQEDAAYEDMDPDEVRVKFREWVQSGEEEDDGSARFMACIRVDELDVNRVLENDAPPEDGDPRGYMSLELVSIHEEEDYVAVGLGYLVPRAYVLIEDPGWWIVYRDDGDRSMP